MSKEAALRAMREARYARRSATAANAAKPLRLVKPGAELPVAPPVADTLAAELCGHRSMNGRTCTREHGHTAKSHRYG
jgi:hypothetical protein